MPTCDLCESSQPAGEACDVCGRPFRSGDLAPAAIPLLLDLEATRYSGVADDVAIPPLPDLEPTAQRSGGSAPAGEPVEGFSATAAEPVGVDVEPLDVERVGDGVVLDGPSPPGPVTCRYCRRPAAPGEHLCAACGIRLPLVRPPPAGAPDVLAPCRDCGIPMAGSVCPSCGARRGMLG